MLVPSFIIKTIWNSLYGGFLERDLSISIWQASLLWGAIITLIYMSGIVRIDFQTIDSIDLDSIESPELREKISELKEAKVEKNSNKKALDRKKKEEILEHLIERSFAMSPDDVQELRTELMKRTQGKRDSSEDEQTKSDDTNS